MILDFLVEIKTFLGMKFFAKTESDANLHKAFVSNAKVTHPYFVNRILHHLHHSHWRSLVD